MPRLLHLIACEKVIVDQESNNPSLIALLDNIRVSIGADVPAPTETVFAPFGWSAISLWQRDMTDSELEFEQRVSLFPPNTTGVNIEPIMDASVEFRFTNSERHRNVIRFPIFPASLQGTYRIVAFLRSREQEGEWGDWQAMGDPAHVTLIHNPRED